MNMSPDALIRELCQRMIAASDRREVEEAARDLQTALRAHLHTLRLMAGYFFRANNSARDSRRLHIS